MARTRRQLGEQRELAEGGGEAASVAGRRAETGRDGPNGGFTRPETQSRAAALHSSRERPPRCLCWGTSSEHLYRARHAVLIFLNITFTS